MWKFVRHCGKHISLDNTCTTAQRLNRINTLDGGICFTNKPLMNGEVFEIQVDKLVTKWTGSVS